MALLTTISWTQSLDETIKYINDRIDVKVNDKSGLFSIELWVDNEGKIHSKSKDDVSAAQHFEIIPSDVKLWRGPKFIAFKCLESYSSYDGCISRNYLRLKVDGGTCANNYFAFNFSKVELDAMEKAFEHLLFLCKQKYNERLVSKSEFDPFMNTNKMDGSERIKMKRIGKLYEIPIEINSVLKTNFLLDTGASDVFLSPEIIITLKRSGTLSENNFIGYNYYTFADGDTERCKKYLIKEMKIGDRVVNNIVCAVANNIIGDMLLGQSFLDKLGNIKINYTTNELIIE